MNSKVILLLKAQLSGGFGNKTKSGSRSVSAIAIGIVAVILVLYAFGISFALGYAGMAYLVPSLAVVITSLVMLFFTAVKANGVLFAYKEYDFMMSLPVKTSTVISSRFMTMYVMNLLMTAAIMLAMGIGYVIWEAPGAAFYIQWILGIFVVPLIPTTLASMLGALIIFFSSRFRYANAVATILSVIMVVAVLGFSFGLGGLKESEINITQLQSLGDLLLVNLRKTYPPAALFHEGIVNGQMLLMLVFFGGSILWYAVFLAAVSAVYKKLNTSLMTFHARGNYKLAKLKTSSQLAALYRKEGKRFFSSTVYCLNMGMGSLMAIIAAAAILFIGQEGLDRFFEMDQVWNLAQRVLPFVIGALISMSCTTSVSLSLEGKNLWIIQSLPIQAKTVFKSKILWNLTLQIPPALIAALLINLRLPISPVLRVMTFLTPVACAFFNTLWGLFINLKMPEYAWASETALIKQSLPSMIGMLGGLIGGFLPVIALVLLRTVDAGLVTAVLTVVIALGAFCLWQYIKKQKIPV